MVTASVGLWKWQRVQLKYVHVNQCKDCRVALYGMTGMCIQSVGKHDSSGQVRWTLCESDAW